MDAIYEFRFERRAGHGLRQVLFTYKGLFMR
jgi:hypothetical protein